MKVAFRNRQLERAFSDDRRATRTWGPRVGPAYIERVQDIIDAKDVDALSKLVRARFHPLKENLCGFHALDLAGR